MESKEIEKAAYEYALLSSGCSDDIDTFVAGAEFVLKATAALREENERLKNPWMSVKEQLPEEAGFYWVNRIVADTHTDQYGNNIFRVEQEKIYYFKEPNVTGWQNDWTGKPSNVTHFCELPAPPQTD